MKKLFFASLLMLLASAALSGCRVGGEIDPDGRVSYNSSLPR